MSELENKTEESPKRRRRTKEEIEATKAAGTYKPRQSKSKKVEPETTEKVEEQAAAKPLRPEESVLIMSCLNPNVASIATEAAKRHGVQVVILEDRVIFDYLEAKSSDKPRDLSDFLADTSNKLHAEQECEKLYAILTRGGKIEDSVGRVFTATQVVKYTNLSHSKAAKLFDLFRAFGLIRYVRGTHTFEFTFSEDLRMKTTKEEIIGILRVVNVDIQRYKAAVYGNSSLTKAQKDKLYDDLQKEIEEIVEF